MNKYLLCSSIICGFLINKIINIKYNPKFKILYILIILGIITSILNHSTTNLLLKYLDRLIIIINIIYIIKQSKYFNSRLVIINLLFAIFCYLCSKFNSNKIIRNSLHLFSHIFSVILFYFIH